MDHSMLGRVVGALPNLPAADAADVVISSLQVVLAVLPSPDPALATFPVLAVLLLGVAVAPSLEG
jgi:hypothetical protein